MGHDLGGECARDRQPPVHDRLAPRPDRPQRVLSHVTLLPVTRRARGGRPRGSCTSDKSEGPRSSRVRVGEIGLHRPDREAELFADRLEPGVAPVDPCHLGLAQVRLEEVHARRLNAEDVVSVERVAAELEGRAVWGGTARLPVHERQAPLPRPETEVGRDPHRRALEVEDLRPVLDRPVLWRRLADFGEQRVVHFEWRQQQCDGDGGQRL